MIFYKLESRKMARLLAILCCVTYIGSYLTRINFGAVTVEIINSMGWDKPSVSAVTTGLFITYGIGQLISGWLCDRYSPTKIMLGGFVVSIAMNLAIPFCPTIPAMTAVWCVNGFAQAMMWPPIVRILAGYCHSKDYQEASMIVTWGCSIGTLAVYLLSSLCIMISGWKLVFFVSAALAALICIGFCVFFPKIAAYAEANRRIDNPETPDTPVENKPAEKMPRALYWVLGVMLLAVIILGALRDSITTWLPNYVSEIFNMGSEAAILSGVVLPLINIIIYPFVLKYYRRFFTNELTCAASIYGISTVAAVILYFTYSSGAVLSIILLSAICAGMHAANFMLISLVPKRFSRYGNVGLISGVVNSFVYVGSAISIWGIASIAENFGWQTTIAVWMVASFCAIIFCIAVARKWGEIMNRKKK